MAHKRMPGPGYFRSLAYGIKFRKNYILPLEQLHREFGNFVAFKGGPAVALVAHPDGVEHILKTNHKNYTKAPALKELGPVLGNGLLTSEGEEWRKHRQIVAPEFLHKRVDQFVPIMQRHLSDMITRWKRKTESFDLSPEISKLTYLIAGECFFGSQMEQSSQGIYECIDDASEVAVKRMTVPLINLPLWIPLPSHNKLNRARQKLDKIVYGLLDDRTHNPRASTDVLSRLMHSQHVTELSRRQIRDEIMTLLLAGHETTANALSWTLYLLGKNPQIQNKLRDEVLSLVKDEVPTSEEIQNLHYTRMVIEESMRLYPPAAIIGRFALNSDEICGFTIAPKTVLNLPQWLTHRLPEYWDRPEEFIPERFENRKSWHPFQYYPFAGGPRECVGKNMALAEAILILAGMIRNFKFALVRQEVHVRALITIRPDPGVIMKLAEVKPVRAQSLELA